VLIASVAWSDVILHARLIFLLTMEPWNPWQMLVEPLGSAEPRLKITGLGICSENNGLLCPLMTTKRNDDARRRCKTTTQCVTTRRDDIRGCRATVTRDDDDDTMTYVDAWQCTMMTYSDVM